MDSMVLILMFVIISINVQTSKQQKSTGLLYNQQVNSKLFETILKKPSELIVKNGFGYEGHKAVTEDGYILTLHRIVHKTMKPTKPPVLFINGFAVAADNWLVQRRDEGLPYLMADDSFDVWLGDHRGTYDSQQHINLPVNSDVFWNISVDEIALYDLPAFIEYIVQKSEKEQIFYIGQSMGASEFLMMASELPKYNKMVRAAALFAPVGVGPILQNALTRAFVNFLRHFVSNLKGRVRNLGSKKYTSLLLSSCYQKAFQNICLLVFTSLFGTYRENLDLSRLGYYAATWGAGASLKSSEHYLQIITAGRLQKFDYGPEDNKKAYGSPTAPIYNLTRITTPIVFYYGKHDILLPIEAVNVARTQIRNIRIVEVPDPNFSHIDTVFGKTSYLVYNILLDDFNNKTMPKKNKN